jgi:hypothetical protein
MVDCQPQFSVFELYNSSFSNEIFMNDDCVDNRIKMAAFTVNIIVYSFFMGFIVYLIIRDKTSMLSWNLRKIVHFILLFGTFTGFLSNVIFMLGIQNMGKYIVFMFPNFMLNIAGSLIVRAWFKASMEIDVFKSSSDTGDERNTMKTLFFRARTAIDISILLLNVGFIVIGPMVTYMSSEAIYLSPTTTHNSPTPINIFYIVWLSSSSLISIFYCTIFILVGNKLINVCQPDPDIQIQNRDTKKVVEKAKEMITTVKTTLFIQIIMVFLPLWLLNNLEHVFYVHFTVVEIFLWLGFYTTIYTVYRHDKNLNTISSSGATNQTGGGSSTPYHGHQTMTFDAQTKKEITMEGNFSYTAEDINMSE